MPLNPESRRYFNAIEIFYVLHIVKIIDGFFSRHPFKILEIDLFINRKMLMFDA